jgi:hypothetical protein
MAQGSACACCAVTVSPCRLCSQDAQLDDARSSGGWSCSVQGAPGLALLLRIWPRQATAAGVLHPLPRVVSHTAHTASAVRVRDGPGDGHDGARAGAGGGAHEEHGG